MPESNRKKVLIITYYWPPAGGPGVQRWLKFVKYLPKFNFDPIVYIPENPSYPIIDESLINEINPEFRVIKHPIREPYKFASILSKGKSKIISKGIIHRPKSQSWIEKIMLYIRGNFFIPDARKSWVKPSIKYLTDYLQEHRVDVIITTGPPHSLHLIGMGLKLRLGINWIADFRDPWTTIGYHEKLRLSEKARKEHLKLELQVLNSADKIIVTSNHTKNEFENKTKTPVHLITNGFDKEEIGAVEKDKKFSIAHIGSLLSERNPRILWKVLSELLKENSDFKINFTLKLVGVVSEDIIASLKEFNLTDYTDMLGYIGHRQAIKHQVSSQVLLLIEINSEETKAIIPGKLFEYLQSGTPILAIGPSGSDVQRLIEETQSGTYFNYKQEKELKIKILSNFNAYKSGHLKTDPKNIDKYSRENLTEKLASIL